MDTSATGRSTDRGDSRDRVSKQKFPVWVPTGCACYSAIRFQNSKQFFASVATLAVLAAKLFYNLCEQAIANNSDLCYNLPARR